MCKYKYSKRTWQHWFCYSLTADRATSSERIDFLYILFDICLNTFHLCIYVKKHPAATLTVPSLTLSHLCFGSPRVHFPNVSASCAFSLPSVWLGYGYSSFPHVKQWPSILLPDLIMSIVGELVASLESHGRQLHPEVGHMVRWVTRADSSRPRDGQRDLAAVKALQFINRTKNTNTWGCSKSQQNGERPFVMTPTYLCFM